MSKSEILKILSRFKSEQTQKYGIIRLGIFGSAARDEMKQESDIDIVIETVEPDPFIIVHIKEDLENIFKTKIDIVRLRAKMNSVLKERIDHEALYV